MSHIYVTGEALIDFVPAETAEGAGFAPREGGSTYNAAKAAARQGAQVDFIGPMASDMFGDTLRAHLEEFGVGTSLSERSNHPTTLAFVQYVGNDARYAFYNNGSATLMSDHSSLAIDFAPTDIVHLGSISLLEDPGAANIISFAKAASANAIVSFDPNARPTMIEDVIAWQAHMTSILEFATIVKLSDEDLELLAPNQDYDAFMDATLAKGAKLVVITLGPNGAIAKTASGRAQVGGQTGQIEDTVGAGDTVMGTLIAHAALNGMDGDGLSTLDDAALEALLTKAMMAAFLNCQHVGCNPPDADELSAALNA